LGEIITVLIVDDHPTMRQGIRALLERQPDIKVVGESNNGTQAIQMACQFKPDVVLMDLQMPGKSGLDAIKEILAETPSLRILVFSNSSEDKTIMAAIEAGAIGYLLKIDATEKIIQSVRDAYHNTPTFSTQAQSELLSYIHSHRSTQTASTAQLTPRELIILKLMANGLTNEEMAAQAFISEGTVRTHISHILQKLHLDNRAQAVLYAVREGLVEVKKDIKK
jgi:NarL family two-component system response regulator LiaR